MKKQIALSETTLPMGGREYYNPKFREMNIEEVNNFLQDDLLSCADAGYNVFTFNRITGTVSANRVNYNDSDLQQMYLDYVNNFLTVEKFAEHYNISNNEANKVIIAGELAHANDYFNRHNNSKN